MTITDDTTRARTSVPLDQGWTLRHEGEDIPARVPGCVHTDLLAARRIPDPFLGRNELDVDWVGRADWRYDIVVGARDTSHERTDLVFEGLDTVAEILLGGEILGNTANMHRSYRFDVTDRLGEAGTPLSVCFTSAYAAAAGLRTRMGAREEAYPHPSSFIRKMACAFGWDWGPALPTAGIWKPARLEHWSTARLDRVRPLVTVDGTTGRVEVRLDVARTASGAAAALTAEVRVAGGHPVSVPLGGDSATVVAEVPDVSLWWPRGYGEQPLYACEVTLRDQDGAVLDTWSRRVGFRTVVLDTTADEHGTGFTFVVNGERVFSRGVNWIPDDVFPSRVTPERYRERLTQAAEAGVDLVRVWGGGIFERDDFYDVCDELGLMVWQDFLFACATYPEEQPLRSEVEAEARENVARLMPHPSLVLWNGNNENLWVYRMWNWEEQLAGDSWGEGYYLALLPRVVAETDPTRAYWAGSPWSGSWEHAPEDPAHGCTHLWDVWNTTDYTDYLDSVPRFVSEFGWQAPPAYATLRRALAGEELAPGSPGVLHHQKAEDGNGKLERGLARHFDVPDDFDRWHYLMQVNQARAVATGVEHWRSHWPVCAGAVVWQLNDCWPVTSWSAVDGDGRLKPLWYELRRLYADRLLSVQVRDGRPVLCAVNQAAAEWRTEVRLRRMSADGTVLADGVLPLVAGRRAVAAVPVPERFVPDRTSGREYLVADAQGLRALHVPVRDKEFAYPVPEYDVSVSPGEEAKDEVLVAIHAHTLLRDALLQADRIAPTATADRGLFTLLPGESLTVRVRGWAAPDAARAGKALFVLR
ncbi:glycosyl hydrolase 2 galactose-binding domain-containing protein [Streptomyces sp. NBC_01497]|uniref:glycosyl hydrolase 2 galactose-binding domain-containing protein n=1 Tax=Streptomyces sp. NBC_01497 TaxID=2903885 RepID=UPI002E311DD7|nr:glycoside hydrolase family 2 protein [Streptomyces sp. NBC_01497]